MLNSPFGALVFAPFLVWAPFLRWVLWGIGSWPSADTLHFLSRPYGMPMKRSPYLSPLSREHLSALILVYCLKNGRSSNPKYPWPSSAAHQRDKVLQMWEQELCWHFQAEERYLFEPFKAQLSPTLQALTQQLLQEHKQIEASILSLNKCSGPSLAKALQTLGQQLEKHVRNEERVYFEGLQQEVSEHDLAQAHTQISQLYAQREPIFCIFTGAEKKSTI
jgi:iron-sulfur cluster repair protein YtfE (RIC family)